MHQTYFWNFEDLTINAECFLAITNLISKISNFILKGRCRNYDTNLVSSIDC